MVVYANAVASNIWWIEYRNQAGQRRREGDAKAFKRYSPTKLQLKREAVEKINLHSNEERKGFGSVLGWTGDKHGTLGSKVF